jgi:hypothetical protein
MGNSDHMLVVDDDLDLRELLSNQGLMAWPHQPSK